MRIAYDVSALSASHGGVATYTSNLLHHLRGFPQDEVVPITHTLQLNKTLWMQVLLPLQLSRLAPSVCHFTNSVASWWTPCPSVVTIHDTTLWRFPRYHPRRRLLAMRPLIPRGALHAKAIIAVSDATKRDVVRTLHVPETKVHVVYEAAAPQFKLLTPGLGLESVRHKYGLPESFILYVGTLEPRKNLVRLLRAFALVREQGYASHALVLAGNRGWKDFEILACAEQFGVHGGVRVLGRVNTQDLVALYNLAQLVAFPSLYEGFGLPVIEAMACGTPVVTSPNGSLAEIAGSAAEFVDPTQVESIADGLRTVLSDADRRAHLRAAGLEQAARFSWTTAATRTREIYEMVLHQ